MLVRFRARACKDLTATLMRGFVEGGHEKPVGKLVAKFILLDVPRWAHTGKWKLVLRMSPLTFDAPLDCIPDQMAMKTLLQNCAINA